MSIIFHILHVMLAGVWLGGMIFTTAVVSPALKAMKWNETERIGVRSMIGKQYARVGTLNLILLLVFAVLDGIASGLGPIFYVEYVLLLVLFGLAAAHGAYFGRRLRSLAEAEKRAADTQEAASFTRRRRELQKLSFGVSVLDIMVSVVVVTLAVLV